MTEPLHRFITGDNSDEKSLQIEIAKQDLPNFTTDGVILLLMNHVIQHWLLTEDQQQHLMRIFTRRNVMPLVNQLPVPQLGHAALDYPNPRSTLTGSTGRESPKCMLSQSTGAIFLTMKATNYDSALALPSDYRSWIMKTIAKRIFLR